MRKLIEAVSVISTAVIFGQVASAASIFVREAQSTELSSDQIDQVTTMVENAVSNLPEHTLVQSEEEADFTLQPSVVSRGDQMVLRVEKHKDGDVLAMSEEPITSGRSLEDSSVSLTENALAEDTFVSSGSAIIETTPGTGRDIASEDEAMTGPSNLHSDMGSAAESDVSSGDIAAEDSSAATDEGYVSGTTSSSEVPASQPQSGDMPTADQDMTGAGETRAAAPRIARGDNLGYFTVGAGPAFSIGLDTDNPMYNILAAYNVDVRRDVTAKVLGDFSFGSGADVSNFINVAVGANYYPFAGNVYGSRPYTMADLGWGFVRDEFEDTENGISVGVGAGFQFRAQELNFDVNIHYSLLTSEINDDIPSVLALRAAINF